MPQRRWQLDATDITTGRIGPVDINQGHATHLPSKRRRMPVLAGQGSAVIGRSMLFWVIAAILTLGA
ncbi:MAG: hypothetical protein E5W09_16905, partial [Mesorhizobium sp.]